MKHVFRTTAKYWMQEEGLSTVLCFLGLAFFAWARLYWLAAGCLIALLIVLPAVYRLSLSRLDVDEEALAGFQQGSSFHIKWADVLFVELLKVPQKTLRIVASRARWEGGVVAEAPKEQGDAALVIPIRPFDHEAIWRLVQQLAPSTAFTEEALHHSPTYQAVLQKAREQIALAPTPLGVSVKLLVHFSYWAAIVGMSACAFALRSSLIGVVLCLLFSVLGWWGVLTTGKIEVDREAINYRTPLRHYRIKWDEITRAEVDVYGALAFYGQDRHLVIYGPAWWRGGDKETLADFIDDNLEIRQIKVERRVVILKSARNVRVP